MPKLTNETLKADLGRHSWYLLHTMLARFPESPAQSDRETLVKFMDSFSLLYPCGECASHFRKLLEEYPVQTSSRVAAAMWGCAIHNKINARLGKEEYDCSRVLGDYDCGCSPAL